MQLETVSKVKGWVALVLTCLGLFMVVTFAPLPASSPDRLTASVLTLVGLAFGISWIRGRRRIRELEFGARRLPRTRRHSRHPICEECRDKSTVVRCVPHKVALCVSCMFIHDDPSVCNYVPDSDKRKHWGKRQAVTGG